MNDPIVEAARSTINKLRQQKEKINQNNILVPMFAVQEVLRQIAPLITESMFHIYPILNENIRSRTFELSIWRQITKKGIKVSRLYAVPHSGFAKSTLSVAINEDSASGVEPYILTLSTIPLDKAMTSINQYIISPGKLIFRSNYQNLDNKELSEQNWILSTNPYEIDLALELWKMLISLASDKKLTPKGVDLEEPLVLSADLINGVAQVLCSGDHIDRADCSWYHGTWQYMRLLDLVSTPTWHDSFYRRAFNQLLADKPQARILVSGTADYSLLAYIISTAKRVGATPDIVVLDNCATPLFACRWFSKYSGFKIRTVQADIFDAERIIDGNFEAITSDAFLTRFDNDSAKKVTAIWANLLSFNNGKIITTVRLHSKAITIRDQNQAIADFVSRARTRLPRWNQFIRQPSQNLLLCIENYAKKMISNQIGDEQSVDAILAGEGLTIQYKEIGNVPGELYPTVYLRVIAERVG